MNSLERRIQAPACMILDGGVGTEFEKRGVPPDPVIWAGLAHLKHPNIAREIHRDYLLSGADVITANTFCAAKHLLDAVGEGDNFEVAITTAIDLAKQARDDVGATAWIAGSMSTMPPINRPGRVSEGPEVLDNFRRQAELFVKAGADLIIVELIVGGESGRTILEICLDVGLPVWAGFSASKNNEIGMTPFRAPYAYNDMKPETFREMIESALLPGVMAAGVMHTKIPLMMEALEILAQVWKGPKMAYAETGNFSEYKWLFGGIEEPEAYARHALSWINVHGLKIIGGCCGTGPEHVRALKSILQLG